MSDAIDNYIQKINVKTLKMPNGMTLAQYLTSEATLLRDCIQKRIEEYYIVYPETPFYKRTDKFKNSLINKKMSTVKVVGNRFEVSFDFNKTLAYHISNVGERMFVPLLVNDGWCHRGWGGKPADHYHKFNGYQFIEMGIADYRAKSKSTIQITLIKTWNGQEYCRKSK